MTLISTRKTRPPDTKFTATLLLPFLLSACGGGGGESSTVAAKSASGSATIAAPGATAAADAWTTIAVEHQPFTVNGTQTVRYGFGSTWIEKSVTGSGQCTNEFFANDPLVGTVKQCQVASATTPPPTGGTSAARIANIELAQSLLFPSGDSALVLLPGKAVLVKVNATTTNAQEAAPAGTLRIETTAGELVETIALTPPTSALPSTPPIVPSFTDAYTAVVPANLVNAGLRLTASLPNGQAPTTVNPRVGGGIAMKFVAIPIQIGGTVGQVVAKPESYIQARMPAASVTLQTRAAYVPKGVTQLPANENAWGDAFDAVLGELGDLHMLEQAPREAYYFGFMPKRTYGLAGLGYVPGNAAVGFDLPSSPTAVLETLTHELGHNFSLQHAPCGGPAGPDPEYPYPNAQLGGGGRFIWGYNAETKVFTDPRRTDIHDIMSYCAGDTYSDYNYRKMQVFQTPTDKQVKQAAAAVAAGPQELLLVSGRIGGGKAEMRPVKSVFGEVRLPEDGPYTLRITTAQGTIDYRFAPKPLDHGGAFEHFAFTIPHPGAVVGMTIVKDAATLMRSQAQPASTAQALRAASDKPQVQVAEQGGQLRLTWDAAKYAYLTVTHVGEQRSTLSQDLQGGTATLPASGVPAGGSFEFSLSDGLNTTRVVVKR